MNRKLRNSFLAMASSALLLVATVLAASPAPAEPMPLHADDGVVLPVPAARAAIRHGVAMPFFSFRPRS